MPLLSSATPMSHRSRAVFALPAVALAVVSVAACGGGSSKAAAGATGAAATASQGTAAGTSSAGGTGGTGAAGGFTAYLSCLKSHGVTVPTGRPGGGTGTRPSGAPRSRGAGGGFGGFGQATSGPAAAAAKACASLRPTGGFGAGGAGNSAALQSQITAYRSCLSDHGVTLPAVTARPTGAAGTSASPGTRRGGFGGIGALNTADPKTAAAVKACAALLPSFGQGRAGAGSSAVPAPSATPNT